MIDGYVVCVMRKEREKGSGEVSFCLPHLQKGFKLDLCFVFVLGTSLAPHERLTDLAVVPREKPHTGAPLENNPRDSPVIER